MTAPIAPLDLANCLDGYVETARRLIQDFGINVCYADLDNDVGEWDSDARTITIDRGSPIGDQVWFLIEMWKFCAIGPGATPAAIKATTTRLRLVGA
jgi:hypothetical protein